MADENKSGPVHGIEAFAPAILKTAAKRQVLWILRWIDRHAHIRKGPYVEFGRRFRFDRSSPHEVIIRERTIIEDNNVWNAQMGDIIVGRSCWFGLNNIVMGPLEVGDRIGTGPYVMILGPRHPVFDRELTGRGKRRSAAMSRSRRARSSCSASTWATTPSSWRDPWCTRTCPRAPS